MSPIRLKVWKTRPMIDRNVDLPHPDGPETETYSPRAISRDTESSARVSSPSLRNTLLTLSRRIKGPVRSSLGSLVSAVRPRLRHQGMDGFRTSGLYALGRSRAPV